MPPRLVISNTSPLINLAGVGQLDLLRQLYTEVWIPIALHRGQAAAAANAAAPATASSAASTWTRDAAAASMKTFVGATYGNELVITYSYH